MKIALIGTGVYGIAVANSLALNENNSIIMWSESDESKSTLEKNRKNYIPLKCKIDAKIEFTTSYEKALKDSDLVFIMCAAKFIHTVIKEMSIYLNKNTHIIIGTKGIEEKTCSFIDEIIKKYVSFKRIGVISGGSFAIDIASLEPIGLSLAVNSDKTFRLAQKAFRNTNIKIRKSNDIIGIEICGAIKNVIALASGILNGLGYNESARAFLITESLHDIKELISSLNGSKKTILSYAGVGDLLLTATSTKSRNYSYGKLIGEKKIKEANDFLNNNTVEGYHTLKCIYALLKRKKVKMPIINLIYDIIFSGKDPKSLVDFLMTK